MNNTNELGLNLTQGNFLNNAMQEIDESIEKMYDGEKLKW